MKLLDHLQDCRAEESVKNWLISIAFTPTVVDAVLKELKNFCLVDIVKSTVLWEIDLHACKEDPAITNARKGYGVFNTTPHYLMYVLENKGGEHREKLKLLYWSTLVEYYEKLLLAQGFKREEVLTPIQLTWHSLSRWRRE